VVDLPGLSEVLSQFATRVAEKVRQQQACAGAVHVFIATSAFRRNDRQHAPSSTTRLVRPTDDTRTIIATALRALTEMYRPGFNYLKAGVMLVDLQPQGQMQGELDLFSAEVPSPASTRCRQPSRVMEAVDALNRRFGRGAVGIASASHAVDTPKHAGRQERRSPRYTTRLDEVPVARA
jgi:DNA polymerase V